jgi:hypothetical protein
MSPTIMAIVHAATVLEHAIGVDVLASLAGLVAVILLLYIEGGRIEGGHIEGGPRSRPSH